MVKVIEGGEADPKDKKKGKEAKAKGPTFRCRLTKAS